MENKKNKKKLFAIIAASALAFVLTIALSVSITLAYFGDTKTGTANVTMGQKLEFSGNITAAAASGTTLTGLLPGGSVDVEATGTIAKSTTTAYLRVKAVSSGTNASSFTVATATCDLGSLVKQGDYLYLANGTTPTIVDASSADKSVKVTVKVSVDKTLTNDVAGKEVTLTFTFEIIQSANITATTVETLATEWASATVG